MKMLFALILFCLLLLPSVGSGQGIDINYNRNRGVAIDYESRYRYEEEQKYRLYNASVYTKNKVRKVELFRDGNNMPFMLTFDKQCRIIKSKNSGESGYTVITDSIFESGKTTVIDRVFSTIRS